MKGIKKIKNGAASFYIVVFSTLILLVVVVSFAAVVSTEMTKTSNDDLSQSAYDSAMAGIEDAKLAYYKYVECGDGDKEYNSSDKCKRIRWYIDSTDDEYAEKGETRCDMVERILNTKSIVGDKSMQEEYTCVKIDVKAKDIKKDVVSDEPVVIKPRFYNDSAANVAKIRIEWSSSVDNEIPNEEPYFNGNDAVVFPEEEQKIPVVSLGLVQTGTPFSLENFDSASNGQTNRGLIYMVPTFGVKPRASQSGGLLSKLYEGIKEIKDYMDRFKSFLKGDLANLGINEDEAKKEKNYISAVVDDGSNSNNKISAGELVKSNNKAEPNKPYLVGCGKVNGDNEEDGYLCSVEIELPKVIGDGSRRDDTFALIVSLPYGGPDTAFSISFFDNDNKKMDLKGQINVDSTGRANDLYRRLTVRLEESEEYTAVFDPLELMGNGGSSGDSGSLIKNMIVTKEWN